MYKVRRPRILLSNDGQDSLTIHSHALYECNIQSKYKLSPGMICRQIKAVAATAPRQDDPTTPILREEMIEDAWIGPQQGYGGCGKWSPRPSLYPNKSIHA